MRHKTTLVCYYSTGSGNETKSGHKTILVCYYSTGSGNETKLNAAALH